MAYSKRQPIQVGETFETNNYGYVRVVEYINANKILVEFEDTGYQTHAAAHTLRKGLVTDHSFRDLLTSEKKRERKSDYDPTPHDMQKGTEHKTKCGKVLIVEEFRSSAEVVAFMPEYDSYVLATSAIIRGGRMLDVCARYKSRQDKAKRLVREARERLRYDDITGEFYREAHMGVRAGERLGTVTTSGRLEATVGGIRVRIHQLVYIVETGIFPEGNVVHKNGDNLDNRFDNLKVEPVKPVVLFDYEPTQPEAVADPDSQPVEADTENINVADEAARLIKEAREIGLRLGVTL